MVNVTEEQKAAFRERLHATGWMEKLYPASAPRRAAAG
jgi:hypothetical protein